MLVVDICVLTPLFSTAFWAISWRYEAFRFLMGFVRYATIFALNGKTMYCIAIVFRINDLRQLFLRKLIT